MTSGSTSVADRLEDLRAEVATLHTLLKDLPPSEFERETPFQGWRIRQVLGHLTVIDRLARLAVSEPECYLGKLARMQRVTATADSAPGDRGVFERLSAYQRDILGAPDAAGLTKGWLDGFTALAEAFSGQDGERTLSWFGRPMKLSTLISARQMEVWAYGQDAFDALRVVRSETDRLGRIVEFGVKTFRFSFANRGLETGPIPQLVLTAPSGATWRWDSPSPDLIRGPAADFCRVVTQRRNVADTELVVRGETAATWMQIAQCISGPPLSGPPPGERVWEKRQDGR